MSSVRPYEIPESPAEGVTSLRWAPRVNMLAATSWDKRVSHLTFAFGFTCYFFQVLLWDVTGNVQAKAAITLEAPPLVSAWYFHFVYFHNCHSTFFHNNRNDDCNCLFVGGCDNKVTMWNLASNQQVHVGTHDMPVNHVSYLGQSKIIVSTSWVSFICLFFFFSEPFFSSYLQIFTGQKHQILGFENTSHSCSSNPSKR